MARKPNADPAATRRAILEAASTLLVEEGPKGLTTRAVARLAEVSPAMVNHHFTDRAGLIETVVDTLYRGVHDIAGELMQELANGATPDTILTEAARRLFRHARAHRPYMRMVLMNVIATGELGAKRTTSTQSPLFDVAVNWFISQSPHDEVEFKLRLRSIVMLITRYAAFSDDELRNQAAVEDLDRAVQVVENHVTALTEELLFGRRTTGS